AYRDNRGGGDGGIIGHCRGAPRLRYRQRGQQPVSSPRKPVGATDPGPQGAQSDHSPIGRLVIAQWFQTGGYARGLGKSPADRLAAASRDIETMQDQNLTAGKTIS